MQTLRLKNRLKTMEQQQQLQLIKADQLKKENKSRKNRYPREAYGL